MKPIINKCGIIKQLKNIAVLIPLIGLGLIGASCTQLDSPAKNSTELNISTAKAEQTARALTGLPTATDHQPNSAKA